MATKKETKAPEVTLEVLYKAQQTTEKRLVSHFNLAMDGVNNTLGALQGDITEITSEVREHRKRLRDVENKQARQNGCKEGKREARAASANSVDNNLKKEALRVKRWHIWAVLIGVLISSAATVVVAVLYIKGGG